MPAARECRGPRSPRRNHSHAAACADGSETASWRETRARPDQDDLPVDAVRWSWRSSAKEQGLEERHGRRGCGGCGPTAAACGCDLGRLAIGRRLDDGALALDRGYQAAVDIVDIAPGLQLAGVVDENALIRSM